MPGEWDDDKPAEEEEYEFTPDDPDWDLSEAHGYLWYPRREHWPLSPGLLVAVSLIVILALLLPALIVILR